MHTNIHIENSGTYLFRTPSQITVDLRQEILVIFSMAALKTFGVVLIREERHLSELIQMLDHLESKIEQELKVPKNGIRIKLFGASSGNRIALKAVLEWIQKRRYQLVAKDTGQNLDRKVLIDCENDRVGIEYAGTIHEGTFVSTGSARLRQPLEMIHSEVLILSKNNVTRILAKQAVEESRHWVAAIPRKPIDILEITQFEGFPWSVVLLFEDINEEALCLRWIQDVAKLFPSVQFRWVGVQLPSFHKKTPFLRLLPPLDPILIPEFKRKLKQAIFDNAASDTCSVFKFPKKIGAKS